MYNPENTAEALKDLLCTLQNDTGRKMSYKELSKDIQEKTGVYISDASLCDYASGKKNKAMSIKNLVALSDYFDVNFDFLIGRSLNRKRENINIGERIGLSDYSIELLESFCQSPNYTQEGGSAVNGYIKLLDELLCEPEFFNLLTQLSFLQSLKPIKTSDEATVSYSPECKQYVYTEETTKSKDFNEFELLREKLYGKTSSVIHTDQYQELLKFNASQSLSRIIDKLTRTDG